MAFRLADIRLGRFMASRLEAAFSPLVGCTPECARLAAIERQSCVGVEICLWHCASRSEMLGVHCLQQAYKVAI